MAREKGIPRPGAGEKRAEQSRKEIFFCSSKKPLILTLAQTVSLGGVFIDSPPFWKRVKTSKVFLSTLSFLSAERQTEIFLDLLSPFHFIAYFCPFPLGPFDQDQIIHALAGSHKKKRFEEWIRGKKLEFP